MNGSKWSREYIIRYLAIAFLALYMYQGLFGAISPALNRSLFIAFGISLIFLGKPTPGRWAFLDFIIIGALIASTVYFNVSYDRFLRSYGLPLTAADMLFGTVTLAIVIEAARRQLGWILAGLAGLGLAYLLWGPYFPGALAHRGFVWNDIVSELYASVTGIYGEITYVLANYMFLLLAFGAFLNASGAGDFYLRIVQSLLGRTSGGGGKAAVVSSFVAGTVTGSAAGNVGITGPLTIPLMKRTGYSSAVAGGVEAAASTGGTILPPVMGAAAFIMAALTGHSYVDIVKVAAVPGVLYFLSVFAQVHLYAKRWNLGGMKEEELPDFRETLRTGFQFFLPPLVLIGALLYGFSLNRVGMFGIIAAVLVSFVRKETRMDLKQLGDAMVDGVRTALPIIAVAAPVSIIAAALLLPGTSIRIAGMLTALTGGDLLLTVGLVAILGFVLGMGLDSTAAYMVLAALVHPALVQLGVPLLSAHMILLWYGQVSNITPPVAMAAYGAAAIAEENIWKVGFQAVRIGVALLYLPLIWSFRPQLLLYGATGEVLLAVGIASLGIFLLSGAAEGYLIARLSTLGRVVALLAAIGLLAPVRIMDVSGAVLAAVLLAVQVYRRWFAAPPTSMQGEHG